MDNMLNFKFGQFTNLPKAKSAGTVYVTTDEQAMYIDLPESHEANAEITRVRIGDIIVKESARDAKPPFAEGAFYYFVAENALLRWDGKDWKQINSISDVQGNIQEVKDTINNTILPKFEEYLKLTGGKMTGAIDMGDKAINNVLAPTGEKDAVNKKYVDDGLGLKVSNDEFETFKTSNSSLISDAKKAGTDAQTTITESVMPKFDEYLPLSGKTMSGNITMGANKVTTTSTPSEDIDVTNKKYVDEKLALKVNTSDFDAFKTANNQSIADAKKAGTDAQTTITESVMPKFDQYLPLAGGNLSGSINMGSQKITNIAAPTENSDATNKKYVDDNLKLKVNTSDFETFKTDNSAAIAEAKKAGTDAQNSITTVVNESLASKLGLSGGTMTGAINMGGQAITDLATPSNDNDAANKTYVDTEVGKRVLISDFNTFKTSNDQAIADAKKTGTDAQNTISTTVIPKFAEYLPLSGGTMSGEVDVNGQFIKNVPTPTENGHAANKKYVDDAIAANDAMTFKGVLGNESGQISALPESANVGDTYKVGVANTYNGHVSKVGDLIINSAENDSDTPVWVHISSGYEDDYLQKLTVDNNEIHLTNGVDNTFNGSVGGFTIVGAENSNLVFEVTPAGGDKNVHTISASMVWGTF